MTGRVLVVGDVITDILVMPQGAIARGTDTRATIRQMPGGSGANQAVWLAAEGAQTTFAARVGAGDLSTLESYFAGRGVTPILAADQTLPTGTLICLVDPDGERSFLTDRGANAALSATDLPHTLLENVALLHVSGYALFEPGPRAAVLALIAAAHASGIPVSIDPASSGFLAEVGPENFRRWTSGADFFFPNADEAELLTGTTNAEAQLDALSTHYRTVILKRGASGAMLGGQGREPISLSAHETTVLDTTGAGDAFLAGFLAAVLRGETDEIALAAAIDAGARAVTQLGAQPT